MMRNGRQEKFLQELEEWLDEQSTGNEAELLQGLLSIKREEVNTWFSQWIEQLPEKQKQVFLEILDQLIFHLSSYFHKKAKCNELEQKILVEGRLFNPELEYIEGMKTLSFHQLEHIESKFTSKFQLYAAVEGGVAGIGHPFMLALDLPALLLLNINMIQNIAGTYGYTFRTPHEQVFALKVLYASTLAKNDRLRSWTWLEEQNEKYHDYELIHQDETIIHPEWLETLAKQWLKSLVLLGLRKKSKKSLSILGIAIGANLNYQFTKQVAQFSSYFYRYRFLHEHLKG